MKRFLGQWAPVAMAMICLCSCGKKTTVTPITDGFSAQVAIAYKEMEIEGQFSCSSDGRVAIDFVRPKSLEGVTLSYDGTAMQMQLGGMSVSVAEDKMPDGGLIRRLSQVLTAIQPDRGERRNGDYVVSGDVDGIAYTLTCDITTGLPKNLSVPNEGLTVTFSQVTML